MEKDEVAYEAVKNANRMKQEANQNLGITQEYNAENRQKLWDSTKAKSDYKDMVFAGKETYLDPISGNVLHKSQSAAQKKYHMRNADGEIVSHKFAQHTANTDHVNSLKATHQNAKHNPFLTDDDFKEIMNAKENYRILSQKDNASKGEKSDYAFILDKDKNISSSGKKKIAEQKVRSDIYLQGAFAARTAQNVGSEFVSGAKTNLRNSAAVLGVQGLRSLADAKKEDRDLQEVIQEFSQTVLDTAVTGGKDRLLLDVVNHKLLNSKNKFLQEIAQKNELAQILAMSACVKDSLIRYLDSEIDMKEFLGEVSEKGTMMVVGMLGGELGKDIGMFVGGMIGTLICPGAGTVNGILVGEVVGEVLGVVITTITCNAISTVCNTLRGLDDYKKKAAKIRQLEREALAEMKNQQEDFCDFVQNENRKWDETVQRGLDAILLNACETMYDLEGVTKGLDQVLSLFGKSVAYKSIEEYEANLDQVLELNF